jgi:hypothetical protein
MGGPASIPPVLPPLLPPLEPPPLELPVVSTPPELPPFAVEPPLALPVEPLPLPVLLPLVPALAPLPLVLAGCVPVLPRPPDVEPDADAATIKQEPLTHVQPLPHGSVVSLQLRSV